MDPRDKQAIIDRYTLRHKRLGPTVEALGSGTNEHQVVRYKVLSSIGNMGGARVLDVGCGYGGFYDYNRHMDEPMTYTGIDIVPSLVEEAARRHPECDFKVMDILEAPDDWEMDYVVSSQAFNNKLTFSDNWEVMKDVLVKCFKIARMGVAIDMISSYVDFREEHLYYFEPCKVFEFCKTLTKRVQLRHDYQLFEFCIYMYPDFSGWRDKK
jgi:SAM-dependent methyltransferase